MAKRPTLTDISSGYTSNTTLNDNFNSIKEAFDNTLSRDGSTPNQMESDLDMNSNDILNAKDGTFTGTLSVAGVDINDILGGVGPGTVFNSTNRFDGDGATTVFTLTKDPVSRANTQVYINGVYQQKNTYSVSGTSLTFTSAPPSGTQNIEVNLQESTSTGTPSASGVSTSDGEDVQAKFDQAHYTSRANFIADIDAGKKWDDGNVVSDGTVSYIKATGATAISDMADWLPFGKRRPEHDGLTATISIPSDVSTLQAAVDRYGSDPVDSITLSIEAGHMPTSGISVSNGDYSKYTVTSAAQATAFLYVTGSISVTNGETITQATSGATGTVESATGSTRIILLSGVSGTFDTTNQLTGSTSGALGANSVPLVSRAGAVIVPSFSGNVIYGQNCHMPTLDCLFAGPGTSALFDGYYARNAAIGKVTEGSGVVGAWSAGLRTFGPSMVEARNTIWDAGAQNGSTGAGCNIWGGQAYLDDASAVWSGYYGIQAAHCGKVTMRNAVSSDAYRHGIRASDAAIIDADGATANDCGKDGSGSNVRSYEGSKVSFVNGTAAGGYNGAGCFRGELNLRGADISGASGPDLWIQQGVVYTYADTIFNTLDNDGGIVLGNNSGNLRWGTYTPTASALTNVSTITPSSAHWMRVGSTVTVSGVVVVATTAAASTITEFELDLPVASNLGSFSDLAGTSAATTQTTTQTTPCGILANPANDTAEFRYISGTASSVVWAYTFSYEVI